MRSQDTGITTTMKTMQSTTLPSAIGHAWGYALALHRVLPLIPLIPAVSSASTTLSRASSSSEIGQADVERSTVDSPFYLHLFPQEVQLMLSHTPKISHYNFLVEKFYFC